MRDMNRFGMFREHIVSREVYKERLSICRSCEDYNKPLMTCKNCGCFMKLKARMTMSECPKNKWSKVNAVL